MGGVQGRLIAAIDDYFIKAGLIKVDVPILQPAEPFLNCVGEDLRRRIFMTENEYGDLLCLRPEFTIPVCLAHIEANQTLPRRYAYLGEVFRQRRAGRSGFIQAGIEDLGDPDEGRADACSLNSALELVRAIAPDRKLHILTGDHGVFDAVLAALGLAYGWQRRLSGCFGDKPRLAVVLDELSKPPPPLALPPDIEQALAHEDEQILIEVIEAQMLGCGLPLHSSRSAAEIARRLSEKAALARQPLDSTRLQALEEFLNLHMPLSQASDILASFAQKNKLDIDAALEIFEARLAALRGHDLALENVDYDGAFGRPLDYYTGFIYEIRHDGQILAGGGRYDHLMHLLGAVERVPAVGFSLWLDRLEPILDQQPDLVQGDLRG